MLWTIFALLIGGCIGATVTFAILRHRTPSNVELSEEVLTQSILIEATAGVLAEEADDDTDIHQIVADRAQEIAQEKYDMDLEFERIEP
jgi:riboflavin synthase